MASQQAPPNANCGDPQHVITSPVVDPMPLGCAGQLKSALLGRFLMFESAYELGLWLTEVETVNQNFPDVPLADRPLATRYLCWRRSVLGCALLPYALSMALVLRTLPASLNRKAFLQSISPPEADTIAWKDYEKFFQNYFYVHAAVQVLYAASLVLSLAMMALAYRSWARFTTSRRWLRSAYLLSFAAPFLLLMIAPYKQVIDSQGAEKKLCEDMLEQASAKLSNARFKCSLPDATMCTRPADKWSAQITRTLTKCGVMRDPETGICPYAEQVAAKALDKNALDPTILTNVEEQLCTAPEACAPCLEEGPETCSNLALAVAGPQSLRSGCARCFVPISVWRKMNPPTVALNDQQWQRLNAAGIGTEGDPKVCAQVCAALLVPRLAASYAEKLSTGGKEPFCVGEETIAVLSSVTALALHFDKVSYAVGVYQAAMTLLTLFPASFSLMFGSIKGATLCKELLSWSRLPGYMLGASIVFCLPMFTALLAVIYQLVGDFWCMSAFISLVLSLLIWLPFGDYHGKRKGVLAPQSHTAATAELVWRHRVSLVLQIFALVFLVVFVILALANLERDEKNEVRSLFMTSRADLILVAIGCVFDVFGKSYLSFVFCADVTIEIICYIANGDDNDGSESIAGGHDPRMLRQAEMADIGVLSDFSAKIGTTQRRGEGDERVGGVVGVVEHSMPPPPTV